MANILWSSKARSDVSEIWSWIAGAAGPEVADNKLDRISARISVLGAHPQLGPARKDIAENARMLVCDRWLILYLIADHDTVHIIRVVDGARDPEMSRQAFNAAPRGSS